MKSRSNKLNSWLSGVEKLTPSVKPHIKKLAFGEIPNLIENIDGEAFCKEFMSLVRVKATLGANL